MTASENNPELSSDDLLTAAALRRGLRHFNNQSARILHQYGLTKERYELLLAILTVQNSGRGATVTKLCAELELAKSSLTQLVRRAHDAGLVDREVSTDDARVRYLVLTDTGIKLLTNAAVQLGPERQHLLELLRANSERPA